jgi:cell division protein FtsB
MSGNLDAAEMPRLDAFDEELGRDPVAIQRGQQRNTSVRFWTFFSVTLGAGIIGVRALAWSAAEGTLRLELQSAVMAPISPGTNESLDREIDRLRRQVEVLKNEITKLKDLQNQTAQFLATAEQEPRDSIPSAYWYSDATWLSFRIESRPEWEGVVPIPRRPLIPRPALRRVEKSKNRGPVP